MRYRGRVEHVLDPGALDRREVRRQRSLLVINNRGYSILKGFRDAIGVGEKVPGLDVHEVEIVQIARGFGVEGEVVERAENLQPAIEGALNAGRPYLLDVIVDREVPELLS